LETGPAGPSRAAPGKCGKSGRRAWPPPRRAACVEGVGWPQGSSTPAAGHANIEEKMTETSPSGPLDPATLHLAVIGNCAISALVDSRARIVWSCMPRLDGDPVFYALVDSPDGIAPEGTMGVEIEGFARAEQRYDHATAILRTRLIDDKGMGIEVTDFAPRFLQRDRIFRPAQLVRRIRPLVGHPRVRFVVRPRSDWGAVEPTRTRGSNHLRFVGAGATLRLTTNAPLTYVVDETWFSLFGPVSFLLGPDETLSGGIEETARDFEEQTSLYWRLWTRRLGLPLEWQDAVIRSAITLKLCQYEETGAIVAAMTTSIPEAPDSQRNWDYRFCWLRDAFFVVRALNSLGDLGTLEDYLRWLHDVVRTCDDGHLQPLYGIGLERQLPERIVPHLRGYRGMGPVRIGNQAYEHQQNDVYGNVVLGAAQAFHDHRLFRRADAADFAAFEQVGARAWALHDQPDAGMWEFRTRSRVHTSSALMCWAACDRLGKIGQAVGALERAALWATRAAKIKSTILEQAWSEKRQAFVASFGASDLDASALLMCEVGFIGANDERFVRTLDALERNLCDGPFMRRYEAPDDYGRPETAFNVCSFWRIDALARIGRVDQAREVFEQMIATRNHVGLLSEDLAPSTGELWGNFPQTYSMVGIVNCAMRLSRPWDSVV
jgi:pentatricopeptide repeat protein